MYIFVVTIWFANIIYARDVTQEQGTIMSDFALMILRDNINNNVMCSPMAMFLSLSKLMIAAKGRTLRELETALGYSQENVREIIQKYVKMLKDAKGVVLTLISNVYASSKYTLSESYQAAATDIFGTGVYNLDFESGEASSTLINSWIKRNTDGKINEIITPHEIMGVSSLLTISAVTFKGLWKTRFKKMLVKSKFYTFTGYIKVPMLGQELNVPYKRSTRLNAELVTIPYKGDQSDFVLILPNKIEDLENIFRAVTVDKNLIENELKSMRVMGVRIFLPEVNIECRLDVTPMLRRLNMDNLLSGTGISEIARNQVLTLDKAIQSAVVEITEFGTSTYFPTPINNMPAGGYEVTLLVDNPFIFIIRINGEHVLVGLYTGLTKSTFEYMHPMVTRYHERFLYQTTEEYDL